MIIKALKTFSDGIIAMHEGEIAKVLDTRAEVFIADGLAIEYSEPVSEADLVDYAKLDDLDDYVAKYDTMPTTEELIAMPNNKKFFVYGFYDKADSCGGFYMVTKNATSGALMLKEGTTTKAYLVALDGEGKPDEFINVGRYGVRSSYVVENMTIENTFAKANSDIIDLLYFPRLNGLFKFPRGRFYFERPFKVRDTTIEISISGEGSPANSADYPRLYSSTSISLGTVLVFPFLTNGQTAITFGSGTLENITILGNKETYSITFNRNLALSDPTNAVVETIKNVDGTDVKCTGLYKSNSGTIKNVTVANFYEGIKLADSNTYGENLHAIECHTGVSAGIDVKLRGVFGWNVYELVEVRKSTVSLSDVRVDSCVNVVVCRTVINEMKSLTFIDVDGDWCAGSVILFTKASSLNVNASITDSVFLAIHGRSCQLKAYDITSQTGGIDIREIDNTEGYGIIRADEGIILKRNHFLINQTQLATTDIGNINYRCPNVVMTYANIAPQMNIFVLNSPITSKSDILKVFQSGTGASARIDIASATYLINETTVDKYLTESEILALISSN